MGIGFNATFLVQIINFYIAYILFYHLLFKPASVVLARERAHVDDINNQIARDQAVLEERRGMQRHYWLAVHNYFKRTTPSISQKIERPSLEYETYLIPSEELIQEQSRQLARLLVKRIEENV